MKKGKKLHAFKRYLPLYLLALPSILYLVINNYIPMAGIIIAFKNINLKTGILNSPWCGFNNFKYLFATKDALIITRNTILYNIAFIILGTSFAILLAILLSELRNKLASKFYQTVVLFPYLVSMIIVSYLAYAFLSEQTGFLNNSVLPLFGQKQIAWYTQTKYWPFLLVFIYIWKTSGYSCIIYLSSIMGIDPAYYEAAALDGASIWQRIRLITLPLIKPTILMMMILSVGKIFYSDFGLFYQVPQNSGALYPVTNVIDTYVYRALLQLGDIGMSSAAGVYQSVIGCILVIAANQVIKRYSEESAIF